MAYILLAEDDHYLSDGLSRTLRHSGHKVDQVKSGVDAEAAALSFNYDLLILDLGLPIKDGLEVLEALRGNGKSMPVLILTARDSAADRIKGLDLGANDYLCKPFDVGELEARIRALLRKEKWDNLPEIKVGELVFDTASLKFSVAGETLDLSPREFHALEYMLQRKGRIVLKNALIEHLSNIDKELSSNALDIVIHRLRKKLEDSGCQVTTVKGLGFIIE